MNGLQRYAASLAKDITKPLNISLIPIVLLLAWAVQMGEWHWTGHWNDWRGYVGWVGGWLGVTILESIIQEVRGRLVRRSARRKAATS